MRVAAVLVTLILLAGCSGSGGSGAVGSAVDASGSPVVAPPTADAATEAPTAGASSRSSVDVTALSGRIVFSNYDDVWTINADGTNLRRLTHSPWHEFDPSLSTDSRFIAYRSEPNEYPELWLMNADGTGQHRLTPDGGFAYLVPRRLDDRVRGPRRTFGHELDWDLERGWIRTAPLAPHRWGRVPIVVARRQTDRLQLQSLRECPDVHRQR